VSTRWPKWATPELKAIWRENDRRERAEARQLPRDEERETMANATVCLIDALIEMRPYMPEVEV
jgi:hypothetical protein